MYIKNRTLATIWRLLLVAVCLYGLIWIFSAGGWTSLDMWSYYTNDSNIVVLVFFSWLLIYSWRHPQLPSWYPTAKGAVVFAIMLTFLIYHFLLSPTLFSMEDGGQAFALSPTNIILHYVVPLMALADWLFFDRKGSFRAWSPLAWLAVPAAYLVFILIRAQFATFHNTGSHYPYFFIDIDTYGVWQVLINIQIITVGLVVLGYMMYFVDFLLDISDKTWRKIKAETSR